MMMDRFSDGTMAAMACDLDFYFEQTFDRRFSEAADAMRELLRRHEEAERDMEMERRK